MEIKNIKLIKKNDYEYLLRANEAISLEDGYFYLVTHDNDVYQIFNQKQFEKFETDIKKGQEKSFEKKKKSFAPFWDNGYAIINSELAKIFSHLYGADIKSKKILGIKGFDGQFYIIKAELYQKFAHQIIEKIKEKETSVDEIASNLKTNSNIVKTICQFLKEEGEILEKKKDIYKFIGWKK